MMKKILRRAPHALACLAAFGAASAANVDPQLTASSRDADALIVFAKSSHMVAPLAPDADYKMRRRALVDSLRAQADVSQRDVRSLSGFPLASPAARGDCHGSNHRATARGMSRALHVRSANPTARSARRAETEAL